MVQHLHISSKKRREIIDITTTVSSFIQKHASPSSSLCHLFVMHTTCALTTADLDPGTDLDMLDAFESLVPKLHFRHPHDPTHVPDHILSSLIGTSLTIPVEKGIPLLGTWQRIVLVELYGPREREVVCTLL